MVALSRVDVGVLKQHAFGVNSRTHVHDERAVIAAVAHQPPIRRRHLFSRAALTLGALLSSSGTSRSEKAAHSQGEGAQYLAGMVARCVWTLQSAQQFVQLDRGRLARGPPAESGQDVEQWYQHNLS